MIIVRVRFRGSFSVMVRVMFRVKVGGSLGGAAVWRLPLAQGMAQGTVLETGDQIPRWAPGAWSLLLPLPVSLPLSLSLCDYHK